MRRRLDCRWCATGRPASAARTQPSAGQDRDLQALRPVEPGALRLAPRVAGGLHVAEGGVELLREAALLEDQVAADLDDAVDVLDQHRAALHAPAAGGALPDRLLGDGVVDQRQRQRLDGSLAGQAQRRVGGLERRPRAPPFAARCAPAAAARAVSAATIWSRRPSMKCFGDSVLPVIDAGQNSMQRPHSVHDRPSSRWRQVRSLSALGAEHGSSPGAGSASRSILRSAPRGSRLRR